ncbi:hypothetical protein HYALB_00005564 [Hymenoscyphus albidus]|uniref:Septation initiation network scaffold protein cdc11 n=1 Tax=Hymenoscyphus albidus TaxID=595503 RepID=A0A9N9LEN5_9HELO|nr:hypothetical protein HYALB_00005564 [Hymenoscyphus albidus]
MDKAWLEDLSEDWPSEPKPSGSRSPSRSPAPSLPTCNSVSPRTTPRPQSQHSRIPKYNPQKKKSAAELGQYGTPLSERSLSDANVPLSQRASKIPSKLRDDISHNIREEEGTTRHRSHSDSANGSVQYNTIEYGSVNISPNKANHETPEWRRRLLQGDVAYGEKRDLFSSAGLENIFKPPPATAKPPKNFEESSVMPSSPPPYNHRKAQSETGSFSGEEVDDAAEKQARQPRQIQYRRASDGMSEFSSKNLSRSSSFQPRISADHNSNQGKGGDDLSMGAESSVIHQNSQKDIPGRVISGQSDFHNEEFSPVFISRQPTGTGNIDFVAGIPPAELNKRLEEFREESVDITNDDFNDSDASEKLELTADPDDFAHNGRFVNLRRGGRSQEASFQRRMLSPSSLPAIDESAMLPEESMQASTPKNLPTFNPVFNKTRTSDQQERQASSSRSLSPIPQTPYANPSKSKEKQNENNSGSPLKLFDTYDTFTNQKLLRRLSQFEECSSQDKSLPNHEASRSASAETTIRTGGSKTTQQKASAKFSSFGKGDLDDYQFSEDISYDTQKSDEDCSMNHLPVLDRAQTTFTFQLDLSPEHDKGNNIASVKTKYTANSTHTTSTVKQRTTIQTARSGTANSDSTTELPSYKLVEDLQTPRKRDGDADGKRLRISPSKDSTPKRRRTLQENEVEVACSDSEVESESFGEREDQSVIGKKEKDASYIDDQQAANPKVLAMREILRPRSPTPSQKGQHKIGSNSRSQSGRHFLEKARLLQNQRIAQVQAELDASDGQRLAQAVGASQHLIDGNRVGSVTTQDFLDEAKKIMAGIRGKALPRSGLASLEESEADNDRQRSMDGVEVEEEDLEDSYQESTREPFSRPPSRDGAPIQRLPQKQVDPELLNHLRKYQETNDFEGVVASSARSISMAKEATNAIREAQEVAEGKRSRVLSQQPSLGEYIESDPPNIRLSANPDLLRKRKHSATSTNPSRVVSGDGQDPEFLTQGYASSGSQSTSRSIPTASSRGSDSRRVIAPETVSHLIPEQVAGMVLDRQRNIWIKRKNSTDEGNLNFLPSDETEEDPFGGIPDLSVDETQELQRIKTVAAQLKHTTELLEEHHNQYHKNLITAYSPAKKPTGEAVAMASSIPANSEYGSEDDDSHLSAIPRETSPMTHRQKQAELEEQLDMEEEIEKEISIHEDRIRPITPPRRRNVTITFSSPLAELIPPTPDQDVYSSSFQRDSDESQDEGNSTIIVTKNASKQRSVSLRVRSSMKKPLRRGSLRGHSFPVRPVSRIDERDEDGYNGEFQQRSVSVAAGTPAISRRAISTTSLTPRPTHEIGRLSLSPLSEFTMHQDDESFGLNVSYVDGGQPFQHGTNTKKTLSRTIKDLVEKITEVEPFEPFWEHIKEMDLSNKDLSNLHKLDEFCGQLVELNASHNQINQLDGISSSVRHLRISHNCLSDLTAWGHLRNLQYIDISNNEIESLSAFKNLFHLRGLRADNNMIKSVDGISQLDGLISLRLRGNLVESIDFRGTELQRLTHLDLRNNQIRDVQNLHELRSLSDLDLEENQLSSFYVEAPEGLETLKSLRLGGNDLERIDIGPYPNLRTLYLDKNRLVHLTGFLKAKHLDSLSLREQKEGAVIDLSFLSEAFEIRKLFMSGNLINSFEPKVDFLNLQYLELANCGLESLAPNLGQLICNTRVLNLNYNALRDISPLVGIVRLKKLHLAGNRLTSLRRVTADLSEFPGATLIDLRANPLTQGYYPPVLDGSMVLRQHNEEIPLPEPYTMARADSFRDAKYARCLDMSTKMLRRLFEIMMLRGCPRLKVLDGLNVNRALLDSRDNIWDALVARGLVIDFGSDAPKACQAQITQPEAPGNVTAAASKADVEDAKRASEQEQEPVPVEAKIPETPVFEERWGAEDSFA